MKKKTTKTTKSTKKNKKMPPKTPKTTDVATPHKAPSVTSRPIVVTNRSLLANDPMLVDTSKKAEPEGVAAMTHRTARTIQPVSVGSPQTTVPLEASPEPSATSVLMPPELPEAKPLENPEPASAQEPEPTPVAEVPEPAGPNAPSPTPEPPKPAEAEPKPAAAPEPEPGRQEAPLSESEEEAKKTDAELEAQAAEEAKNQKLEELISAGTYAVPINAVQRKRSRMFVAVMCIFALLLLVVLLDALLDAGLLRLSVSVPHTHFFSAK